MHTPWGFSRTISLVYMEYITLSSHFMPRCTYPELPFRDLQKNGAMAIKSSGDPFLQSLKSAPSSTDLGYYYKITTMNILDANIWCPWYTSHYLLFYDWLKLWQHLLEISTTFLFTENHASSFNGDDFYNFPPEISSPPSTPLHAGWPPWRTCRSPSLAVLRSGSSVFSNLVALWRPHSDRGTSCPCFPGSFYTSWPCLWGRSLVLMLL